MSHLFVKNYRCIQQFFGVMAAVGLHNFVGNFISHSFHLTKGE